MSDEELKKYIVNKQGWLWLAPHYFNQWRVFPRAFIIFYFWLCMETALWFMGLPNPGAAQAAFASAIISAGAAWFGLYVNSGPGPMNFRATVDLQPNNQSIPLEDHDADSRSRNEPRLQQRREYSEEPPKG